MPPTLDPSVPIPTDTVLDACPGCGGGPLFAVGGDGPNFLCRACSRCWHVGESVTLVDPLTCPGCAWRPTCLSRFDCILEPGHPWPHLGGPASPPAPVTDARSQ